jgi:hypothetical protein
MNLLEALNSKLLAYLRGEISLRDLREWFAPVSLDARSSDQPKATKMAYEMIGDFSDFDEGFLDEAELQARLLALSAAPFASSYVEVSILGFSNPVRSSTVTAREDLVLA